MCLDIRRGGEGRLMKGREMEEEGREGGREMEEEGRKNVFTLFGFEVEGKEC